VSGEKRKTDTIVYKSGNLEYCISF
jgi:hypothetical protein